MTKTVAVAGIICMIFAANSCGQKEAPTAVSADGPLVYLKVEASQVSSFDITPDWAPRPDPMAPVDGDMLTRWSSELGLDNQWIAFDFGKEKTLAKIVIRWEQAYAVDYDVLASSDGANWKEVLKMRDSKGGAETLGFKPTKARYVKILGLKRNKPNWGISIWEIEFYGPQGANPGDTILEEEYLKKEEAEKMKEAVKKLIAEKKAMLAPLSRDEFHKGVVYTSWSADELLNVASDLTLIELHSLGVRHIAIMVPAYQDELDSTRVYTNDAPGGDTPVDSALTHAIDIAHSLGIKVMLKPHVDPRSGEARVDIVPGHAWFDSYKEFIVRYAKLAEKTKCEMFAVGTELEATTMPQWDSRWRDIIKAVKEVYKGAIIYSANWTEYKEVTFWDEMDFVGIDAYFPLTGEDNPSLDALINAWEAHADTIEKWLIEKNIKIGVLFTELGYSSCDGTNKNPWTQLKNKEDQDEQADSLRAAFSVLTKRTWFKGIYLWQYFPQERWSPLGFTIKGKKAEAVVREWYSK